MEKKEQYLRKLIKEETMKVLKEDPTKVKDATHYAKLLIKEYPHLEGDFHNYLMSESGNDTEMSITTAINSIFFDKYSDEYDLPRGMKRKLSNEILMLLVVQFTKSLTKTISWDY